MIESMWEETPLKWKQIFVVTWYSSSLFAHMQSVISSHMAYLKSLEMSDWTGQGDQSMQTKILQHGDPWSLDKDDKMESYVTKFRCFLYLFVQMSSEICLGHLVDSREAP